MKKNEEKPAMKPTESIIIQSGFAAEARRLKDHFRLRFASPREGLSDRFVWDYWHVPGQYTLLRTPAYHFFPQDIYLKFHQRLVDWGRKNLGCHDVSPPWLSYYIEGCGQELHADNPHGPWAFVFSLTDWAEREFQGGETILLSESVLDYWRSCDFGRGMEMGDLTRLIPQEFNQLLIFDPRIPHGVREVRGVKDPPKSRIVIHGWFLQPRPFVEGALSPAEVARALRPLLGSQLIGAEAGWEGMLSLRLTISQSGRVRAVETLVCSVRGQESFERSRREIQEKIKELQFKRSRGRTQVTLPLIFRN